MVSRARSLVFALACYIRISMNVSRFFFSYFWFSPRLVAGEAIVRK